MKKYFGFDFTWRAVLQYSVASTLNFRVSEHADRRNYSSQAITFVDSMFNCSVKRMFCVSIVCCDSIVLHTRNRNTIILAVLIDTLPNLTFPFSYAKHCTQFYYTKMTQFFLIGRQ